MILLALIKTRPLHVPTVEVSCFYFSPIQNNSSRSSRNYDNRQKHYVFHHERPIIQRRSTSDMWCISASVAKVTERLEIVLVLCGGLQVDNKISQRNLVLVLSCAVSVQLEKKINKTSQMTQGTRRPFSEVEVNPEVEVKNKVRS